MATRHIPTDETRILVKMLYSAGVAEPGIAFHIGLKSDKALRKHYRKELDEGKVFLGAIAIKRLVRDMTNPKSGMAGTTAAIWVSKNNLGWKDKVERSGDGDTNVTIASGAKVVILPSNGRDGIAQDRLISRQSPPMIESHVVEAVENE